MKLRAPGKKPIFVSPVYPNAGEELEYRHHLERMITAMHSGTMYWLKVAWRKEGLPEDKQLAEDLNPQARMTKAMKDYAKQWLQQFDSGSETIAKQFAKKAMKSHDISFVAALRKAGFSVKFQTTGAIESVLDDVIAENVKLIKSIPREYFDAIIDRVRDSVEKGRSMKELTHYLEDRYGVTQRRAALIARDQNNKATAAIHRTRQKESGISKARWVHTMASAQPREEHMGWDGEVYDIDKGMYSDVDGEYVWPGTPINCGCTCMSIIPGLDEEDDESEGEE
jgi:SPP1 gp7 family putative phage head morphogenesis protein